MANTNNATTSIRILLSLVLLVTFCLTSFVNQFPVFSYDVTSQNNEGIFSSLSRNFDKTLENINSEGHASGAGDHTDNKKISDSQDNKKISDSQDNKKISDKKKGSEDLKSNHNNKNNANPVNSTNAGSAESIDPLVVNSTEPVEIKTVDLDTSI